jgi:L-ascorbate metabolism protein UlaG (beta-lactamase superfamily)
MQLTYLFHSGFMLEGEHFVLLFDYWKDPRKITETKFLSSSKKQYVLSSHVHHDHFSKQILTWKKQKPELQLILSDDILLAGEAAESDALFMSPYQTYTDDKLTVRSFGSTDEGLSFVIEAEGKTILHAGDLNNWHWQDEGNAEYSETMEKDYLRKLVLIQEAYPSLDVAIFPVDKRLGSDYYRGAQQLVEAIKVSYFVPMHFEPDYEGAYAFEAVANENGAQFFMIEKCADNIDI